MSVMPVYIQTAAELKGSAWAARYPEKADDLYVVARSGKKRKTRRFGPPTAKNRAAAERKRDEWAVALERTDLSSSGIIAPLIEDAARDYLRKGMTSHAAGTRRHRRYQLDRIVKILGSVTLDRIDADRVVDLYDTLRGDHKLAARSAALHIDGLSCVYVHHEIDNPVPDARDVRIHRIAGRTAVTGAVLAFVMAVNVLVGMYLRAPNG